MDTEQLQLLITALDGAGDDAKIILISYFVWKLLTSLIIAGTLLTVLFFIVKAIKDAFVKVEIRDRQAERNK